MGESETLDDLILVELDAVSILSGLDSISEFYRTQLCADIKQRLEESIHNGSPSAATDADRDEQHKFLLDCIALSSNIENETVSTLNYIREIYRSRFPELGFLINRPVDYAIAVKLIETEPDAAPSRLHGLFPEPAVGRVVSALPRIRSDPLCEEKLRKALAACDRALALDPVRKRLLGFVAKKAQEAAPNLSALVGAPIAAELIGAAAGLSGLSAMSVAERLLLGTRGRRSRNAEEFCSVDCKSLDGGYLAQTAVAQEFEHDPTPVSWFSISSSGRDECCKVLARFVCLAARIDSRGKDESGERGREMMKAFQASIEKLKAKAKAKELEGGDCSKRARLSVPSGKFPVA